MSPEQKALYKLLFAECERVAAHYGLPSGIPEHIDEKILLAVEAHSDSRTKAIMRVRQAMEVHALAKWAKGEASGPPTQRNLEDKAKKADSLAKMLEKRGSKEAAERQRARAERIRGGELDA